MVQNLIQSQSLKILFLSQDLNRNQDPDQGKEKEKFQNLSLNPHLLQNQDQQVLQERKNEIRKIINHLIKDATVDIVIKRINTNLLKKGNQVGREISGDKLQLNVELLLKFGIKMKMLQLKQSPLHLKSL